MAINANTVFVVPIIQLERDHFHKSLPIVKVSTINLLILAPKFRIFSRHD